MSEQQVELRKAVDEVLFPEAHGIEQSLKLLFPTGATDEEGQPVLEERTVSFRYRPMPIKWAKALNLRLDAVQNVKTELLSGQLASVADLYTEVLLLMCEFYRLRGVNREVLELSFEDADIVKLVRAQAEVQSRDSFLLKLLRTLLVMAEKMGELTDLQQAQTLAALEKQLSTTPSVKPGESATMSLSNGIPAGNSLSLEPPVGL